VVWLASAVLWPVAVRDRRRDVGAAHRRNNPRHRPIADRAAVRRVVSNRSFRRRPGAANAVAQRYAITSRVSAARKQQDHALGEVTERNTQDTAFLEVAVRGSAPHQTWVTGVAFERATLDPHNRPEFSYAYSAPGIFGKMTCRFSLG
jgi:hypothetical protein